MRFDNASLPPMTITPSNLSNRPMIQSYHYQDLPSDPALDLFDSYPDPQSNLLVQPHEPSSSLEQDVVPRAPLSSQRGQIPAQPNQPRVSTSTTSLQAQPHSVCDGPALQAGPQGSEAADTERSQARSFVPKGEQDPHTQSPKRHRAMACGCQVRKAPRKRTVVACNPCRMIKKGCDGQKHCEACRSKSIPSETDFIESARHFASSSSSAVRDLKAMIKIA
jgi:hypothetical protein